MERTYIAIDLKSFYASVECIERGLDPLKAYLVVADESRTSKTICLAVSPALKAFGIPGRCRLFEVEQKVKEIKKKTGKDIMYIAAVPRMSYYMQYSANIYNIYLKYVSSNDIHVYSIDEVFMDVTEYLNLYKMTSEELARKIIKDVLETTGITATAGIGSNLYLAKIAMDIVAKHKDADENGVRIASLDEYSFRELLWEHTPLTDFWRIGKGISRRLEANGMHCAGDIARMSLVNEDFLYKLFGIDAEILIDHAWGKEPVTIENIKSYHSKMNSLTNGQVLSKGYSKESARVILKEMIEQLCQRLIDKKLVTSSVGLMIGYDIASSENYDGNIVKDFYGRSVPEGLHFSVRLNGYTASLKKMEKPILNKYDQCIDNRLLVRRIFVFAGNVLNEEDSYEQFDLFSDVEADAKETDVQKTMLEIQKKYGKNSIFKGRDLLDEANLLERNGLIGGHKSDG